MLLDKQKGMQPGTFPAHGCLQPGWDDEHFPEKNKYQGTRWYMLHIHGAALQAP